MKNKFIFLLIFYLLVCNICEGQQNETSHNKLPAINLKDLYGKRINTSEITNSGNPIIIVFWTTCCKPPVKLLDEIAEYYDDWAEETGVILYAVSVDDARSSNQVMPFVNGKGWEYEVLLDPNSDFKRAMNVLLTPHILLLNGNQEIVWQKTGYATGDEGEIFDQLINIKKTSK